MFGLLLIGSLAQEATAEDDPVDCRIGIRADSVVVHLDLAELITRNLVQQLQEGIDFQVSGTAKLKAPRRLIGSRTIKERQFRITLSYRLITETYQTKFVSLDGTRTDRFLSLIDLHRFLADSMWIGLTDVDALEADRKHFVLIEIDVISLSHIHLLAKDESGETTVSPIGYLFGQFLDLTGYGQTAYSVESAEFKPADLNPDQSPQP